MRPPITSVTKLDSIQEGKWFYFDAGWIFIHAKTGVMLKGEKCHVRIEGGQVDEPIEIWFSYNQAGMNEIWEYSFGKPYREFEPHIHTMGWVIHTASLVLEMLEDTRYQVKTAGRV